MSKYAQEVKKVREELVQMQIEIENELVDAIKNREKILHDARVKALDDEIDMIEKLSKQERKPKKTTIVTKNYIRPKKLYVERL